MKMEVTYDEENFEVTTEIKDAFAESGYIIVRRLFSPEEIKKIIRNFEDGEDYHKFKFSVTDSERSNTSQATWNFPGNDVSGMAVRTQKMVETSSRLLRGEVYHYHSKFVITEPKTGGQSVWHQDYGFWYNDVLLRELITAFIAIDPVNKANGYLQVLDGSHTAGRIKHAMLCGELADDTDRVQQLQRDCRTVLIELQQGDVVFLHGNILRKSDANTSDKRRTAFLPVYNRKSNSPVKKGIHSGYIPLDVVYNEAVLDCENYTDLDGKGFIDINNPEYFKSVQSSTFALDKPVQSYGINTT